MSFKSYFLFFLITFATNLLAQDTSSIDTSQVKEIEILHADKLEFNTLEDGTEIRKLVGAVALKHNTTLLFCDSAYIFKATNQMQAWGHIHIIENDSIHAYSDELIYDGNTKVAQLIDNARLEDDNKTLTSDILIYDIQNDIGSYTNEGKLVMDSTILTSKIAYYYTNSKIVHFNKNVHIEDPDYQLDSDTMHYYTESEVAKFYGKTRIYNDSSQIDCFLGTYDTQKEIATFGKNTVIYNDPQILYADSLYYERYRSYGRAFYHFDWIDTEMEAGMEGTNAEYFENSNEIIAYNRPLLKVKQDDDTLYLKGDIIHNKENIKHGEKEFWSYKNVRIYKTDLQGKCDSLFYSFYDTTMRMYEMPVLWNEQNQLSGDSIFIFLVNDQVDQIHFMHNAFAIMQSQGKLFDQIKAQTISGFFVDNEMKKMIAKNNAESLYFGKNNDDEYIGANYAQSSLMHIYLVDKEVDHITFIKQPEAVFTPISQLPETEFYLKDFNWLSKIRPKSKEDL